MPAEAAGASFPLSSLQSQAAKQQWRRVADQFRPKMPKLAALMDEDETDVLA